MLFIEHLTCGQPKKESNQKSQRASETSLRQQALHGSDELSLFHRLDEKDNKDAQHGASPGKKEPVNT